MRTGPFHLTWILLVLAPAVSHGMEIPGNGPPREDQARIGEFHLVITTDSEWLFESDLSSGGRVGVSRTHLGLQAHGPLSSRLDLHAGISLEHEQFNFSGNLAYGGVPWGDIHTTRLVADFEVDMDAGWTLFAGPMVEVSREMKDDPTAGMTWTGFIGGKRSFGRFVTVGLGGGLRSMTDEEAQWFPVVIFDWQVTRELRLSSLPGMHPFLGDYWGRTGIELVYMPPGRWEYALGAAAQRRRFRIDGNGPAPEGAGQETTIPLYARAGWKLNPFTAFDIRAGISALSKFKLDSSEGIPLNDERVTGALQVGISMQIAF